MFEINYPVFDKDYNTAGQYFRKFIESFSTYTIGDNIPVITSYRDITEMPIGSYRYECPTPSQYMDASVNANSVNIECTINPLFINSGFKLILSTSFGSPKIFLSNMDHTNRSYGGIAIDSNGSMFFVFNNAIADTDRLYSFILYSSENTAYFSFVNQYRYMLFTRLTPIDQADGYKYMIIATNQTGAIGVTSDILFIDNTIGSFSNTITKAVANKPYRYNFGSIDNGADTIDAYNFIYDKWYSEDIFYIDGIGFDGATVLNGKNYFPLGNNLYLRVKG